MTAALCVVFALLSLVIVGMFLVAWLDDRICVMRRDAADPDKETPPKGWGRDIRHGCKICGGSGTVQGCFCPSCMVPPSVDPRTAPTDIIPADPDRRKTQRGEWGRA